VPDLEPAFQVRVATVVDIPLLAGHRAAMFRDMGRLASDREAALVRATADYFRDALPRGDYLGWVAQSTSSPPEPIGGAGVQLRPILPRPRPASDGIELGRRSTPLRAAGIRADERNAARDAAGCAGGSGLARSASGESEVTFAPARLEEYPLAQERRTR
jgi:hypothetical protein